MTVALIGSNCPEQKQADGKWKHFQIVSVDDDVGCIIVVFGELASIYFQGLVDDAFFLERLKIPV